jgi:alpha-L-fucosidase
MNVRIIAFVLLLILPARFLAQQRQIAVPSEAQYRWHEQERLMFVHFGMATWQGKEYDDGDFDLSRVNPSKLNTDQWCEVARSWGAKQIIFVAKHVGGFCWWPTSTTEYCVRNIPWKNGKGDLFAELANSCKKYGINLGVYIYPGDVSYGAGIGSGGKTADPSKQEAYNKVFRQQLTEVLTNYGSMTEVWFDGSCVIDVKDILEKYAKNAVIFQGPQATIRWPGTESGQLYYPAWNTLKKEELASGVATQYNDDPNGDAWGPLEPDAPLYNHAWFWSAEKEKLRRSVNELTEMYYHSVGYGSVLLLNATPDTTGLIPPGDVQRYKEFGNEINRRFSKPVSEIANQSGIITILPLKKAVAVNHVEIMEDYRKGERIREYKLEGLAGAKWKLLSTGSSVGRKKIDNFSTQTISKLRLTVLKSADTPLIRSLKVFNVAGYIHKPGAFESSEWKEVGYWDTKSFVGGKGTVKVDLSKHITKPGQYEVKFLYAVNITGMQIDTATIRFEDDETLQSYIQRKDAMTYYINRTSQVDTNSSSVVEFLLSSDNSSFNNKGTIMFRARRK